jgi:hypothetical protein
VFQRPTLRSPGAGFRLHLAQWPDAAGGYAASLAIRENDRAAVQSHSGPERERDDCLIDSHGRALAPPGGTRAPSLHRWLSILLEVAGVRPAMIPIGMGAHTPPFTGALQDGNGFPEHQLGNLLRTHCWRREYRRDRGTSNGRRHGEGAQEGFAGGVGSAHCRQCVTPRKLQSRQMKVPHLAQGYPSEARSSRPQARHSIASCSWSLVIEALRM